MPRASSLSATCPDCGQVVSRQQDLPRHMLQHSAYKEELMYPCRFKGCHYKNLQKSNLETHERTHTGEKTKKCPECGWYTSDPGSLTRHRKSKHGYQPAARKSRLDPAIGRKAPVQKMSYRHSPYNSRSSSASASSQSSKEDLTFGRGRDLFDLVIPTNHSPSTSPVSTPDSKVEAYEAFPPQDDVSFAWFKAWQAEQGNMFYEDAAPSQSPIVSDTTNTVLPSLPVPQPYEIPRSPSPKQADPAVDTGRHLRGADRSYDWYIKNGLLHPSLAPMLILPSWDDQLQSDQDQDQDQEAVAVSPQVHFSYDQFYALPTLSGDISTDAHIMNSYDYLMAQPHPTVSWDILQPQPVPMGTEGCSTFDDMWALLSEGSQDNSLSHSVPIAHPTPLVSYDTVEFDWVSFAATL